MPGFTVFFDQALHFARFYHHAAQKIKNSVQV